MVVSGVQSPSDTPPVTPARIGGRAFAEAPLFELRAPWDGRLLARLPECDVGAVETACAAAVRALQRGLAQARRAEVLEAAAARLAQPESAAAFAARIVAEAGKPRQAAEVEVARATETLRWSALEARRLAPEGVPLAGSATGRGRVGWFERVPRGVVAAITPFNFPLNLVAHKLAPAIAAGCPVVLKPAPQTPLSALALVGLLVDCGLPADWISVLTGRSDDLGRALVADPRPAVISFTGSDHVGWAIAAAAPRKHVCLELGSIAPVIVDDDQAPEPLADRIVKAAFAAAGQSCISVQRILLPAARFEAWADALVSAARALPVGDPADPATVVGPLVNPEARQRIRDWIEDAERAGARVLLRGAASGPSLLGPTILADVPEEHPLRCREVFGPVCVLERWTDYAAAIAAANASPLRIHVGVFTDRLAHARQAVAGLDFGGVLIGEVPTWRHDAQPYGGVGAAGEAREGPRWALEDFTRTRFVSWPAVPEPD